ncbi:MAG: hypothetical protein ACR2NB_09560 [Solirubrobacteraceae bacterium]
MDEVIVALREYLHLPDADHVRVALATAVTAFSEGDPLWTMLVAAPSSGKTEMVRALDDTADAHVGELTAAGLLSWRPGRGKTPAKPAGLLTRLGPRALVTIGDFSTVLAMSDRGQRDQLFALLRRLFDGEVVRDLGSAPEPLVYRGRVTMLAAVTPSIDRFSSHSDQLGPRWLFFRIAEQDSAGRRQTARAARIHGARVAEHRARVRQLADRAVQAAAVDLPDVKITDDLADTIDDAAIVACLGRAAVQRDGYGRRDILDVPVIEEPPRLVGQLVQLARGLLALGHDHDVTGRLGRRAALDSIPQARRRVLVALHEGESLTVSEIARRSRCDRKVARFALEELEAVGLCRRDGPQDEDENPRAAWHLAGVDAQLVAAVIAADETGTKSRYHPPTPPKEEGIEDTGTHTSSQSGDTP